MYDGLDKGRKYCLKKLGKLLRKNSDHHLDTFEHKHESLALQVRDEVSKSTDETDAVPATNGRRATTQTGKGGKKEIGKKKASLVFRLKCGIETTEEIF